MPPIIRISLVIVAFACALVGTPTTGAAQATESINAARRARGQSEAASAGRSQTPPAPARGAAAPQAPAGGAAAPQTPAPSPQPAPPAPGQPPAAQPGQPAPPPAPLDVQGFTYNPEGRRDPFVSLLRRGGTTASGGGAQAARPAGLAGLAVNEVVLRGTVQSRDGFVAILQGADQKTYIVRPGDKLFDGSVRTITQNDMVFVQQVNDPLSLEKQREVRKVLRQTEGQN